MSMTYTNNIVGNVIKLAEYKKEISNSTEHLIVNWMGFVTGFWISQQTKYLDFNFMINDFVLVFIPLILLLVTLMKTANLDRNTIYTSGKTTKEKMGLLDNNTVTNLRFSKYLKTFIIYHPLLTLNIVGLIINQIYFMDQYRNILNLLEQIPLVGSFYEERFSIILVIILFIIGNYLDFIKTDLIRYPLKIFVYIHLPVIIAGELLGFCSIFIYPIISIFNNPIIIYNFKNWIINYTNFFVMIIVPVTIIVLYRLTTIRDIDEEINKFSDKDGVV